MVSGQVWAKSHSHHSSHKKFKGIFLQGNGDNFADPNTPNEIKCPIFNEHGKHVGYVHSTLFETYAIHSFVMKDGSCFSQKIEANVALPFTSPITEDVVAAIPELAPYLGNEDAELLVVVSNQTKNGPGILCWKNCGPKGSIFHDKVTSLDVRCVFLLIDGRVQKCIDCSWAVK